MREGVLALISVAACAARTEPSPSSRTAVYLTPVEHLSRVSLALRGVRPTVADLRAVASDPGRLPAIVDRYLDSPEFATTVRELHDQTLLLHVSRPEFTPAPVGHLAGKSFSELQQSYFDEPLRLIEDVVMSDQPYSTIVTADYTMADPTVAEIFGMPHSDQPGWEHVTWPDGRPAAGILVSDALHLRFRSAGTNYHRGRANAVSRALLCHDFLAGDVMIDPSVNLADPAVVSNAVVANPSCAACHQTLDPLASYFFPFEQGASKINDYDHWPQTLYSSKTADDWMTTTNRAPRYFGRDAEGLDGLGQAIAADPRFPRCTAQHFASYLTEVPEEQLSEVWLEQLDDAFVKSNLNARQLVKAIVLSEPFRVASDGDPVLSELAVGYQKLRPAQLERMLADLTGYRWRGHSYEWIDRRWPIGDIDYLEDDYDGFRVLAGGMDDFGVTQPVHTMNATSSMVMRLAAYHAADFVVKHDAAVSADARTLFTVTDVVATDETSVRAELAYLHARIYGELNANTDATYGLFMGALAANSGDAKRAWVVTLTGMLSDLRAVYY